MRGLIGFALLTALAGTAFAMGSDPEKLRLNYEAEAYRSWPVMFGFTVNGASNGAPQSVRCCTGKQGAPGNGSGAGITILYEGDRPGLSLDVLWFEVHSARAYRANLTFSPDEIEGWNGNSVYVTFSFLPNGGLELYADGPEVAATRTPKDVALRDGADLGAMLTAPSLGRAHTRADYVVLRQVCGTVEPDPPAPFTSAEAAFAAPVLEQIEQDKALPLPAPQCKGAP